MNNSVIIPFYLDEYIINNLYTIVIAKFAKIESVNIKEQSIIKFRTPLSDICHGKYMQGDLDVQYLSEFSRREEKISVIILVLLEIIDILKSNDLLKSIKNQRDLISIEEGDFILFNCKLKKDPVIKNIENIINIIETEIMFSFGEDDECNKTKQEILKQLKVYINDYKENRSLKYMAQYEYDTKTRIVVPLQGKYMEENIEYLIDGNVTIFGKAIKVNRDKRNKKIDMLSGTYLDYLDDKCFEVFKKRFLKNRDSFNVNNKKILETEGTLIEIIPIAMYI
ncbi:hypothetical protein ACFIJ5_06250 [Haloimpatiens sp. FM7330]|uniref:DUF6414 family protein n=1 Tax=Haloimpatiens sp. FM7330 TaxID=3298610 RepID=UPI00362745C0